MVRFLTLCLVMVLGACVTPATTDPAELPAGAWTLDAAHSSVVWQVRHMGLSWYTARFDEAEASLDFDPASPETARLTAIVHANSVSTGDADFDEQLRGGGWLGAANHPEIVFRTTNIEVTAEAAGRAEGELTLKGQTHDAVMAIQFYGGTNNPLEDRRAIGFSGEMDIDFAKFGVGRFPATNFIGDTVRVRIEAEFLQSEDEQ